MWALVYVAFDKDGVYQRAILGFYKTWAAAKKAMYSESYGFIDCSIEFAGDYEIDLISSNGNKLMLFIDNGES